MIHYNVTAGEKCGSRLAQYYSKHLGRKKTRNKERKKEIQKDGKKYTNKLNKEKYMEQRRKGTPLLQVLAIEHGSDSRIYVIL